MDPRNSRRYERGRHGSLSPTLLVLALAAATLQLVVPEEAPRKHPTPPAVALLTAVPQAFVPVPTHLGHHPARSRPEPRALRKAHPTGHLRVVRRVAPRSGPGTLKRFLVEVEGGLRVHRRAFARFVEKVLYAPRGWTAGGRVAFKLVDSPPVSFRVALASPATTDVLCAPLRTEGRYSCHQDGRAVLNLLRYRRGARTFAGDLVAYRKYLVNHEVGHALGHWWHRSCPAPGSRAPVMMQQTKSTGGCKPNGWPLGAERASIY